MAGAQPVLFWQRARISQRSLFCGRDLPAAARAKWISVSRRSRLAGGGALLFRRVALGRWMAFIDPGLRRNGLRHSQTNLVASFPVAAAPRVLRLEHAFLGHPDLY